MDWKFGNQLNCLNGILLQRSDLLKPKCTLCYFSSVTRGFLIKILGLLLWGKNTWTFGEHEIKEEAVLHYEVF